LHINQWLIPFQPAISIYESAQTRENANYMTTETLNTHLCKDSGLKALTQD